MTWFERFTNSRGYDQFVLEGLTQVQQYFGYSLLIQ